MGLKSLIAVFLVLIPTFTGGAFDSSNQLAGIQSFDVPNERTGYSYEEAIQGMHHFPLENFPRDPCRKVQFIGKEEHIDPVGVNRQATKISHSNINYPVPPPPPNLPVFYFRQRRLLMSIEDDSLTANKHEDTDQNESGTPHEGILSFHPDKPHRTVRSLQEDDSEYSSNVFKPFDSFIQEAYVPVYIHTLERKVSKDIHTPEGKASKDIHTHEGKVSKDMHTHEGKVSKDIHTQEGKGSKDIHTPEGKVSKDMHTHEGKVSKDIHTQEGNLSKDIHSHEGKVSKDIHTHEGNVSKDIRSHEGKVSKDIHTHEGKSSKDIHTHEGKVNKNMDTYQRNVNKDIHTHEGNVSKDFHTHKGKGRTDIGQDNGYRNTSIRLDSSTNIFDDFLRYEYEINNMIDPVSEDRTSDLHVDTTSVFCSFDTKLCVKNELTSCYRIINLFFGNTCMTKSKKFLKNILKLKGFNSMSLRESTKNCFNEIASKCSKLSFTCTLGNAPDILKNMESASSNSVFCKTINPK